MNSSQHHLCARAKVCNLHFTAVQLGCWKIKCPAHGAMGNAILTLWFQNNQGMFHRTKDILKVGISHHSKMLVRHYKESQGDEPTGNMCWTCGGPTHLEVMTFASFTQMKSLYKSKRPKQASCRAASEDVNHCISLLGTLKGSIWGRRARWSLRFLLTLTSLLFYDSMIYPAEKTYEADGLSSGHSSRWRTVVLTVARGW